MAKSVRYKLNKSSGSRKRRRVKGKLGLEFKKIRNLKPLKIIFLILVFSLLGYWFFIAYTTVRDIRVTDVVGESEIIEFADSEGIYRTLIIYEEPNTLEENNLFMLGVIHNFDTSEALIYYFPGDLHINDYFVSQHISIQNLTYAGESYMYREKYAYAIKQIEEQMAINFDNYVLFGAQIGKNFVSDSSNWGSSKEEVLSLFSKLSFVNLMPKYYKVHLFEEHFHSNMNFLEMYSRFQNIQGIIASDNYEYIDLGEEQFVVEKTLGSGKKAKILNTYALDESVREHLDVSRTRELRGEHVKVEVYNGSDIPGYARTIARRIHNSGCRVIRFENTSVLYDETKIYVADKEKFSVGLGVVTSIVKGARIIEGRPDFLTTGDIVVVLGVDE